MRKEIGVFLFFSFITVQIFVTFTDRVLYPLNPYRMFSKNWQSGIEISGISAGRDADSSIKVWKILNIPFFQTNKIMMDIYYGKQTSYALKNHLCQYIANQMSLDHVKIYGEMDKYVITQNSLDHSHAFREKTFSCKL